MSYVGPKWFYQILGRYLISTFSTVCNFRQRGTSYQAMYILLGLDSSTLNIPYWDFKYKHNLQGRQKCEYKHNLLGLRKCEYKHNLLGLPKVSKKHSLVGIMHTPRQKNTFPKFRVCKRQKISSTSTIVGLFHVGYQNDQHITRNIFHPTFKKVPARNPTKDICSYTVPLVGPKVPLRHCETTY